MESNLLNVEATPEPTELPGVEATAEPVELTEGETTPAPSELPAEAADTVSGGDSVELSGLTLLLEENNKLLTELVEHEARETLTIWEKPLSEYTPQEGIQLVLLFAVLFAFVYAIVEGVIKW